MNTDEIEGQWQLLATHRQRLTTLLKQVAVHGEAYALPAQISGIAEARAEIARLKQVLCVEGEEVTDAPNDQAPADRVDFKQPPEESLIDLRKFIDRESEQGLFEELLRLRDDSRILAIRAGSGMGKSNLLKKFRYHCRVTKPRIPVSLVPLDQLSDASPLAVIRQIVRQLSATGADFSTFNKNERARMAGDFHSIRAFMDFDHASFPDASGEMKTLTLEQDSVAQEALVRAFFTDLDRYCANHTAVIMLDAYERCERRLQEWILEHLLERVCFNLEQRPAYLVMVIAGGELPIFEDH